MQPVLQPECDFERHVFVRVAVEQAHGAVDRNFGVEQAHRLARSPESARRDLDSAVGKLAPKRFPCREAKLEVIGKAPLREVGRGGNTDQCRDPLRPAQGEVQGWNHFDKADRFHVDVPLDQASADDYDALLLPGGVANPDQLRTQPRAVQFVKQFFDAGKPVGVICHGPWTLIEAGVVKGRTMTSWPSLRTDLVNAGAKWVDQEVVTDRGLVSSRKPADLPAFTRKLIDEIEEGSHAGRTARAGAEQRVPR